MIPRFQYPASSGTILTMTNDMELFNRVSRVLGGQREAASGAAASRTIRRDFLLAISLRVHETEISAVETMVAWMQDHPRTAFTFWPDYTVSGTSFSSYLISPVQGEDLLFPRTELASIVTCGLTLRRSTNTSWGLAFYTD